MIDDKNITQLIEENEFLKAEINKYRSRFGGIDEEEGNRRGNNLLSESTIELPKVDVSLIESIKKELSDSEVRWRFAIEGAGDGLWDWNLTNNKVFFSTHWKTMLGFDEDEVGDTLDEWSSRVHPDDLYKCNRDIESHLLGVTPLYTNTHRMMCKNGDYKWVLDRGQVIERDNDNKPTRMIGIHTDISERIELEKRLTQSNLDKDRFISIIAHDLRSPFNTILGFSELSIKQLRKGNIEKTDKYLQILRDSSFQTYEMLNNLLDWVKSQAGKMVFEPRKANLNNIIIENIMYLDSAARKKNIEINFMHSSDIYVWCDKNMIDTVLRNLISNAIKYTNVDGVVEISCYPFDDLGYIVVSVLDNGVGIVPEIKDKLFRLDVNVSTYGTQAEKGSGYGLILCKEFVERNGGKIWIDCDIPVGSNFLFTLPLTIE